MKPVDIAKILNVSRGAVSQWLKKYRKGGKNALLYHKIARKHCRLTTDQKQTLIKYLEMGAVAFGFSGELWTRARISALIFSKFGIRYHVTHIGRILKGLGWTWQKPVTRATQRNEEAIGQWIEVRWPEIKKASEEGRTIVFADESGFYLLPFSGHTYAPKRKTPVLHHKLSRDHLSVISGITEQGGMYVQIHEKSIKGEGALEFLKHVLTYVPGKVLVIWDGAPIHKCQLIRDFLKNGTQGRLELECLPGYAPDLNPDEGVWRYLKCVSLKNVCCKTLEELKKALRHAIRNFRARKDLITACFRQAGIV